MRIRIGEHEVEGTAEEVARLLNLMASPKTPTARLPSQEPRLEGASPFVSEEVAYEVLTRRPLGPVHTRMLRKLQEAGDAWTTAPELQTELALSTREFAGLLGAFGRRLSHTDGAGSRSFFDQYWDHENGYNLYRLPPSVRAALTRAKVI